MTPRLSLAVWKFASCGGCQRSLLDVTSVLLELAERLPIVYFPELSSDFGAGPFDVSLVEGSIVTPHDAERILYVRRASRRLIALGACATAGGPQALKRASDTPALKRASFPRPEEVEMLPTSTPIAAHVAVDFELRGCPVAPSEIADLLIALANGRTPRAPWSTVCLECRAGRQTCVMVTQGAPCLGPATQGGCGALCPSVGRACFGCHGPTASPQPAALERRFQALGLSVEEARRRLGWLGLPLSPLEGPLDAD